MGKTVERYHLAVFYLAVLETFLLMLHWIYLRPVALHFVALYLHVNQFLLMFVYYARMALRVAKHIDDWGR